MLFYIVILAIALSMVIANPLDFDASDYDDMAERPSLSEAPITCFYAGSPPYCEASCPPGFNEQSRDACGDDDDCCSVGEKAYCCGQM